MQESIYNIVPKEYVPPPKEKRYKSKYPPTIPPTGSTFLNHTTSKPNHAANLSGDFDSGLHSHPDSGKTQTFGHLKGDRKPTTSNFLKKGSGTMGNEDLPLPNQYSYDCQHKKPPVPCVHEKPVQGLRSNKNFIVTNAIQNILSTAKRAPQPTDWTKKKDYGQVPEYLNRIKDNIDNEYKMIQNLHSEYEPKKNCLSEEEVKQIREGLKRKWNQLNREYQKITHVRTVDTIGLKTKKEGLQKQLAEVQKDIKQLNKAYVFIDE